MSFYLTDGTSIMSDRASSNTEGEMMPDLTHDDAHEPTWWEDSPELMHEDHGQVGGDLQVGPAYGRRYVFGPVDGTDTRYFVVDESVYAVIVGDAMGEPHDPELPYGVEVQVHYSICTDFRDPGSSEIHADLIHESDSHPFMYETIEQADEAAKETIAKSGLWTVRDMDPTKMVRNGVVLLA